MVHTPLVRCAKSSTIITFFVYIQSHYCLVPLKSLAFSNVFTCLPLQHIYGANGVSFATLLVLQVQVQVWTNKSQWSHIGCHTKSMQPKTEIGQEGQAATQ